MATFQHDLSSMLRAHGFGPPKTRGGYNVHKRRDGVVELTVRKGNAVLLAWYRKTPREELFVQEAVFEKIPAWAQGKARKNAGRGASRAVTHALQHGAEPERALVRSRGEMTSIEEEEEDEMQRALRAAEIVRSGGSGVVRIPKGAKARARKMHKKGETKLEDRKPTSTAAQLGVSQDMWRRMHGLKNPATSWETDLTVPQLWREADGGSYPAMVELERIGAYRPEIGKPAQWQKGVKWAATRKNPRGQRDMTMLIGEDGAEWAAWSQDRQGIVRRNRGSRGGYSEAERSSLPGSAFLKPKSRTWPVSDQRHAIIAIQYMTAGRGKPSEYPVLIRRLAKHWPLRQNKAIWKHYLKNRSKIARKAGRPMPTLNALDKG